MLVTMNGNGSARGSQLLQTLGSSGDNTPVEGDVDMEDDDKSLDKHDKVVRRRERNKELARKSRQKKKVQLQQLHTHVTHLTHENIRLREQVRTLYDALRYMQKYHNIPDSTPILLPPPSSNQPLALTQGPSSISSSPPATTTNSPTPSSSSSASSFPSTTTIPLGNALLIAERILATPVPPPLIDLPPRPSELDQEAARVLTAIYHNSPHLGSTKLLTGASPLSDTSAVTMASSVPSPLQLAEPSPPQSEDRALRSRDIPKPIALPASTSSHIPERPKTRARSSTGGQKGQNKPQQQQQQQQQPSQTPQQQPAITPSMISADPLLAIAAAAAKASKC